MSDISVVVWQPQNINITISPDKELVIRTNEQGPEGPQGVPWNPGATGGTGPRAYTHEQSSALTTWTITHNLGFRPAWVHVVDYQGNTYTFFPIEHTDSNTCLLYFGYALSGFAYLS